MTTLSAALALALAAAAPRETFVVDPAATVVRFHLTHKLHQVYGRSSSVEGKAVVEPDGKVLAMVRIPVASFDSGDSNRDAHMRETLAAGKHPFVVFKGLTSLVVPAAHGKPIPMQLRGELDFHGVTRPIEVPVTVEFASDGTATVRGKMTVSLEAHEIDRPSLLFVKVGDACTIELDLKLRRASR
ncbi:MAG TPA: YceI family protein [Anaeromyxobacter sp.]